MSALDQSMRDLIAKNNLCSFTLQAIDYGDRIGFSASVQWEDDAQAHGRGIATGNRDTIAESMADMFAMVGLRRGDLHDEAIPTAVQS